MERELINHEYLRELLSVAQDQDENDLVSHLFDNLLQNRNHFLDQSSQLLADEPKLQFELHKLKNQFANLGCEAASQLLEQMYQLARHHDTAKVRQMLEEFHTLSDTTLKQLQSELSH